MRKQPDKGIPEFLAFLRNRIDNGIKQKDIAEYIKKHNAYINRLYLKDPKSCPVDIQIKIAEFFGISYGEMISQGEKILIGDVKEKEDFNYDAIEELIPHFPHHLERRSIDPQNLLRQLDSIKYAILQNIEKGENYKHELSDIKRENSFLKMKLSFFKGSFKEIFEGITFFNAHNELAFSTNRWNLLPSLSESKNRSIDAMIISLKDKVKNFDDVISLAKRYQLNKKKENIVINFIGKGKYFFKIIPIFEENEFIGTAIINSPIKSKLNAQLVNRED